MQHFAAAMHVGKRKTCSRLLFSNSPTQKSRTPGEAAMGKDLRAYNIFDLRQMALRRVPKGLFEFVDRGTED